MEEIRILIIEDEEIWSRSISAALSGFGFTVAGIARDFEDAIKLLNTADFDLALIDISIGQRNNGLTLGSMMSTLYKKPFIFLTACKEHNVVDEAIRTGPIAYLIKPADDTTLYATIQSSINRFYKKESEPQAAAEGGGCNVASAEFDGVDLQSTAIVSGAPAASCDVPGGCALHHDAVAFNAAAWAALGDPAEAFAELGA